MEIVENGVEVSGEILVKILYITSEDKAPFASLVGSIPFTYQLDAPNICEEWKILGNQTKIYFSVQAKNENK